MALEPLWVMSNQNMPDGVSGGWRPAHSPPGLFPAISTGMAVEALVANVLPNLLVITAFLHPTLHCRELTISVPNPPLSVSKGCNKMIIEVSHVPGQLGKRGELKKALLYCIIFWIKGKITYS